MAAKEVKKFVRIHSDRNITVTPGLQSVNHTRKDSDIPDRLKVSPTWSKCLVDIKKGAGIYPVEILEWNTVKALVTDKVLTIGEYVDSDNEEDLKLKAEVKDRMKEIKEKSTAPSLNEIIGD